MADEQRSSRSYEAYEEGQQLYRVIEFCNDPETLWGKIESGNWQWLGIHPSGKFVLGRPPVQRFEAHGAGIAISPGTTQDNRIEYHAPRRGISGKYYATADEARAAYNAFGGDHPDGAVRGSGIWRLRLFTDGNLEAERLVVRARTNYL